MDNEQLENLLKEGFLTLKSVLMSTSQRLDDVYKQLHDLNLKVKPENEEHLAKLKIVDVDIKKRFTMMLHAAIKKYNTSGAHRLITSQFSSFNYLPSDVEDRDAIVSVSFMMSHELWLTLKQDPLTHMGIEEHLKTIIENFTHRKIRIFFNKAPEPVRVFQDIFDEQKKDIPFTPPRLWSKSLTEVAKEIDEKLKVKKLDKQFESKKISHKKIRKYLYDSHDRSWFYRGTNSIYCVTTGKRYVHAKNREEAERFWNSQGDNPPKFYVKSNRYNRIPLSKI